MGKKKERKIRVKFSWGEKATKRETANFMCMNIQNF
jgi:hypothetical protein